MQTPCPSLNQLGQLLKQAAETRRKLGELLPAKRVSPWLRDTISVHNALLKAEEELEKELRKAKADMEKKLGHALADAEAERGKNYETAQKLSDTLAEIERMGEELARAKRKVMPSYPNLPDRENYARLLRYLFEDDCACDSLRGTFGIMEKILEWIGANFGRTRDMVAQGSDDKDKFLWNCTEIAWQLEIMRDRFAEGGLLEQLVAFIDTNRDWDASAAEVLKVVQEQMVVALGRDHISKLADLNAQIRQLLNEPEMHRERIVSACNAAFDGSLACLCEKCAPDAELRRLYKGFLKGVETWT